MVSTLIARAQESDTVLGPVSWLFDRQVDAIHAMAQAVTTVARPLADAAGPAGLAVLGALVLVPIVAVVTATLTGAAKTLVS
jgi:hypothetical protein